MNKQLQVRIVNPRVGRDIPLPAYATEGSAGMALRACIEHPATLQPGAATTLPMP